MNKEHLITSLNTIASIIKEHDTIYILSHREPDGDAITSQLGLKKGLEKLNKTVHLLSPGPFSRPEVFEWSHLFQTEVPELSCEKNPLLIILDCSSPERIANFNTLVKQTKTVIIDHHATGKRLPGLAYIRPEAPSCTLLVQEVLNELNIVIDYDIAYFLFYGFATDTGFFRFLQESSLPYWPLLEQWLAAGVSPNSISEAITRKEPLSSRVLLGRLLSRSEGFYEGQLILTYENSDDKIELGLKEKDSFTLYELLLRTINVKTVAVIRENEEGSCNIGLRSNTDIIDVSVIAESLGGGGHKRASGAQVKGKKEAAKEKILLEFGKQFSQKES